MEMKRVLSDTAIPIYLDDGAKHILQDARSEYARLDFDQQPIRKTGKRRYVVATWAGTIKTSSLALALGGMGYQVSVYDGFLDVKCKKDVQPVDAALTEIAASDTFPADKLLSGEENLTTEKFHRFLSTELLLEDALSSRIDLKAVPELARAIIRRN